MSDSSINVVQSYQINGKTFNAPIEWEDVEVVADFTDNSIQPSISIDSFSFTLEAREEILNWIRNGNIFEGLPIEITLDNINEIPSVFNGYLELNDGLIDRPDDNTIECKYVQTDGLDAFFDKLETITYGYLESIGVITKSDYVNVDYVVEKKFNASEILITSIMIYLMAKELQESIVRLTDNIAEIVSFSTAGATGPVASAIYAIASALINVIYTAAMIIAIRNMQKSLLDFLLPPRRTHKTMTLKRLLEVVCNYYGYGLSLMDDLFDNVHYLPSNMNLDEVSKLGTIENPKGTQKGIPNSSDIGYVCSDMFNEAKKMIDGKFAIINNVVHLRPKNDPYWQQQSSFKMPNVLVTNKSYNTEDLNSTMLMSFETDINDEYTIDNYRGTAIEVKTDVISSLNQNNVLLKGYKEIKIAAALGNRKQSLNALENSLKVLSGTVDSIVNAFGGNSNFKSKVKTRVGLLKVSENYNSIPKLIYITGGSMPSNHRSILSASALWNKYYTDSSFVLNSFRGQKAVHKGIEIPFGLESFKKLLKNSYFYTAENQQAKIETIKWRLGHDTATIDFWVREVYTRNLKETQIIPD